MDERDEQSEESSESGPTSNDDVAVDDVVENGADSNESASADSSPEDAAGPSEADTSVKPEASGDASAGDADPEGEVVELNAAPEVEEEPEPELTPLEALQRQLDVANARLRTVSKGYTDQQAEMKAFRERLENQAKYRREQQAFVLAKGFFEPVQNLKRSLAAGREDPSQIVEGVEMVLHQFTAKLKDLGMEEVPGVGAVFDPKVHEALGQTPVFDADQDGKVLAVLNDGFLVNGKVLQAAQVVVGKYQEPAGEA